MALRRDTGAASGYDLHRHLRKCCFQDHGIADDADIRADADDLKFLDLTPFADDLRQIGGTECDLLHEDRILTERRLHGLFERPFVPLMQCGTGSFLPSCVLR